MRSIMRTDKEPTQAELLKECISSRKFLLTQIADLAEQNGDIYLAQAWRWIRDTGKWPSKRKIRKNGPYGDSYRIAYNWILHRRDYSLKDAEGGGPSLLPYWLYENKYLNTSNKISEEEALTLATKALAYMFKAIAEGKLQDNKTLWL